MFMRPHYPTLQIEQKIDLLFRLKCLHLGSVIERSLFTLGDYLGGNWNKQCCFFNYCYFTVHFSLPPPPKCDFFNK